MAQNNRSGRGPTKDFQNKGDDQKENRRPTVSTVNHDRQREREGERQTDRERGGERETEGERQTDGERETRERGNVHIYTVRSRSI